MVKDTILRKTAVENVIHLAPTQRERQLRTVQSERKLPRDGLLTNLSASNTSHTSMSRTAVLPLPQVPLSISRASAYRPAHCLPQAASETRAQSAGTRTLKLALAPLRASQRSHARRFSPAPPLAQQRFSAGGSPRSKRQPARNTRNRLRPKHIAASLPPRP